MKLTRMTTSALIVVILMTVAIFVCLKTNINCRSLLAPRNCIAEHLRKIEPSFKEGDLNKSYGKDSEAKPCAGTKKEVFVDWRRLYWGNLGELTKPDSFFAPRKSVEPVMVENPLVTKNEALRLFTLEIRAALKAFEKRYGVKIHWYKNDLILPDVTNHFINFWDKGFKGGKEIIGEERRSTQ